MFLMEYNIIKHRLAFPGIEEGIKKVGYLKI